ncbi:hypothetical protein POM88_007603 [Heracleum sosnowskyi]|uniref:Uncharacterized protein n=1 Tax=Heracleum sosnowskyi TaxID=360622 RepID=A0AAD8N0Z9_9APIA|nr:hypothetical protein POM88_007603 [Heracleum sosnowskyi]
MVQRWSTEDKGGAQSTGGRRWRWTEDDGGGGELTEEDEGGQRWRYWLLSGAVKVLVMVDDVRNKISLFYFAVLAGLLQWFPFSWSQHTTGQLRNWKSGSSSVAKETEHGESIMFADVAGVDEAKEELEEIVEFLRNPERYLRVGARPPRGVLLVSFVCWLIGVKCGFF